MAQASLVTLRHTFTAGALVRKDVVSYLRQAAWRAEVDLDIQEDRRWLSSRYYYTVRGTSKQVSFFNQMLLDLDRRMQQNQES